MSSLTIGRLSEATGVKVTTIRYYESIGLLPAPPRTEGNRRLYGQPDVERLIFIRRSRAFGLSMEAIRDLLALGRDREQPCHPAIRIAEEHLAELERKIAELDALKVHLKMIIGRCSGDRVEACQILLALRSGT